MQTVTDFPRTHDIVCFDPAALDGQSAPEWVADALKPVPFAVVRRVAPIGSQIPVGIRGVERHQRWGGWIDLPGVTARWQPEDLIGRIDSVPRSRQQAIPALQAVAGLVRVLDPTRWRWGPTGSVGFELVSGRPTARETSDLDLILRCDSPLDRTDARRIADCLQAMPVRCDMLLETPFGAVALLEYAGETESVVVRTFDGPQVTRLPWREADK